MIDYPILDEERILNRKRPRNIVCLFFSLAGLGCLPGVLTSGINGVISEQYFHNVQGWEFGRIWIWSAFAGFIQGATAEFACSIALTIAFIVITKMKSDWTFIKKSAKETLAY